MISFTIREARRQDTATIVALWQEMMDHHRTMDPRFQFAQNAAREFEYHVLSILRSREAQIFVAEAEGKVIGYTLGEMHARKPLYPVGKYGFISDISVRAAFRRHGVGRALVQRLMEWFRRKGATTVELFVAVHNPGSTAFWHAMGFTDFLRLLRTEL